MISHLLFFFLFLLSKHFTSSLLYFPSSSVCAYITSRHYKRSSARTRDLKVQNVVEHRLLFVFTLFFAQVAAGGRWQATLVFILKMITTTNESVAGAQWIGTHSGWESI